MRVGLFFIIVLVLSIPLTPDAAEMSQNRSMLYTQTDGINDLEHFEFNLDEPPSSISMNILIQSLAGIEYVEGAEVGCFTEENLLAGATALYGDPESDPLPPSFGFAVWGDEPLTQDEIEGFTDGEEMTFMYWDPQTDMEYDINFMVNEGEDHFQPNGFMAIGITVGVEENEAVNPSEFGLTSVYPNPFNSSTTIQYGLSVAANIEIKLFDQSGRLLKVLENGYKASGFHSMNLTMSDFAAGTYILRLKSGNQIDSKPLYFLK